ncbi:MAG TPA: hypothetical protein VG897_14340 [Terriglobales bacterium]|nr:hypothetical protein [Terriglobales bacterium]
MKAFFIVFLLATVAVAQDRATATEEQNQTLLRTIIENSLKDIRALHNFVYQQSLTTQRTKPGDFHGVSEDVVETVIADGKVFARRVKHNGHLEKEMAKMRDTVSAPAFDAVSVFGPDVPFEELADYFRVLDVERSRDRLVLKLKRNERPGPTPDFNVRLEIEPERLKVTEARYDLDKPNKEFRAISIICRFVAQRGHWLPGYTHYAAETHRSIMIERTNKITYKAFEVNSRILTDFK